MKIAKIVKSNSHIDYVGRVIDSLDVADPPLSEDFAFADFVSLPQENGSEIIGVIYNSMLINPEYANFGPRLSPKPDLGNFSPDYLNEQGFLIGILLIGTKDKAGKVLQGVPPTVVPAGQDVYKIGADEVKRFHTDERGSLQIHYYSQIISHAGLFAVPLLEEIINKLTLDCSDEDKNRLLVLKQNLAWQRTIGGMRL
jgi:hypothetical protein